MLRLLDKGLSPLKKKKMTMRHPSFSTSCSPKMRLSRRSSDFLSSTCPPTQIFKKNAVWDLQIPPKAFELFPVKLSLTSESLQLFLVRRLSYCGETFSSLVHNMLSFKIPLLQKAMTTIGKKQRHICVRTGNKKKTRLIPNFASISVLNFF